MDIHSPFLACGFFPPLWTHCEPWRKTTHKLLLFFVFFPVVLCWSQKWLVTMLCYRQFYSYFLFFSLLHRPCFYLFFCYFFVKKAMVNIYTMNKVVFLFVFWRASWRWRQRPILVWCSGGFLLSSSSSCSHQFYPALLPFSWMRLALQSAGYSKSGYWTCFRGRSFQGCEEEEEKKVQ